MEREAEQAFARAVGDTHCFHRVFQWHLLGRERDPLDEAEAGGDPERVREGMSGNLCRCGAYAGITEAVLDAQERMAERGAAA